MIETEGLTHLHLYVRNLDRSLRFYQDVFGLIELFRDGEHMVFLRPPNSADTITLNERPDFDRQRGGIEHFGFRLKDPGALDDAVRQVIDAGGRLIERGEHAPGATFAYVEDPDGHMIEL